MKKAVVDIDGILWLMGPDWAKVIQRDYPGCPLPGEEHKGTKAVWKFYEGYMTDEQMAESALEIHMRQNEFHSFQNAGRLTKALQRKGFHVTIASHRDLKSEVPTRKWLDNNDIPYDELYLGFDKHFLLEDADIFIDDSPASQQIALDKGVPVLSIRYDYNEHVEGVKFYGGFFGLLQGLAQWLRSEKMDEKNKETITISMKEYDKLLGDSQFLNALQGAGVDNWDGYEIAQDLVEEWGAE